MLQKALKSGKRFSLLLILGLLAIAGAPNVLAADPVIGPGDTLAIQVDGQSALSKNYTVDEQGDIIMDYVGKVKLAGLTPKAAQNRLSGGLKNYLKYFDVSVSIAGDAGAKVLVFGEVARPGAVKVQTGTRLLDVLAEAGQPTSTGDTRRISVIRKATGRTERIDLNEAIRDASQNVKINPGDTITVPAKVSNMVEVEGEVRTPGSRSLDSSRTAYAAIMGAGPLDNTDWSRVQIRRKGSETPLTVDLYPVRTGQAKDDLELMAGDHITVPSRFRGTATLRGEVKTPGERPLSGHVQLMDFIAGAGGGFTDRSDRTEVQILRDGKSIGKYNLEEVETGIRSSDDPELEVRPGDVVFVPSDARKRFAIVGGVRNPGEYPTKEGMRLLDAVTQAEGFTTTVNRKHLVIAPADPNDERVTRPAATENSKSKKKPKKDEFDSQGLIVVDYGRLFKGDPSQNVAIKPGDRILVPEEQPRTRTGLDNALRLLPLVGLFAR